MIAITTIFALEVALLSPKQLDFYFINMTSISSACIKNFNNDNTRTRSSVALVSQVRLLFLHQVSSIDMNHHCNNDNIRIRSSVALVSQVRLLFHQVSIINMNYHYNNDKNIRIRSIVALSQLPSHSCPS